MRPVCKKEEVMRPIPGQPGLFRLDDFSVPPPATGYTWDVPRGRPWVLGDLAFDDELRETQRDYDKLKRGLEPLVSGAPFDAAVYERIARFVVAAPASTTLRLTREQFAQVARGTLSTAARAITLAQVLAAPGATPAQLSRARELLTRARRNIEVFSAAVQAIRTAQRASRAVGLGGFVVDDAVLVLAALAAGTLIAVIGVGFLIATISEQQATEAAIREADAVCAREAEQGRPCGGPAYQEALRRAREAQNEYGFVPNLNDLFKQGGSLLFWGGLLVLGAGLAYAAWTAEPARKSFAQRFASEPLRGAGPVGRQRSTKRRSRA